MKKVFFLPIHTTAIGKVLVAYLPEDEILRILELLGMEKKTRKSITTKQKFLKEMKKVREYGFTIDNEENADDVRCLAAPIFDAKGNVAAAFGTSSTILHIDEDHLPKFIKLVKKIRRQNFRLTWI